VVVVQKSWLQEEEQEGREKAGVEVVEAPARRRLKQLRRERGRKERRWSRRGGIRGGDDHRRRCEFVKQT
jgi:hypothetical protein